ncbi:MAG: 3'-5' exonuclease, partial [Bdellovibrionota bacterium]
KSFQHGINNAKCSALEPHELEDSAFNLYAKNLSRVYELYQRELFKNNAIDFGEIITLTYRLLRDNPDLLDKYQKLYQFIHVDEYQDTNRAQYLLVKLLASQHRNLCVVGDEDQSIYRWRGADIRNILDFEKDYPEAVLVKLEQNYRSTQTIISASSHVIANNTSRKAKTLWTQNELGERISRFQVSDDRAEAELVVSRMKQECAANGYAFSDAAVFYRTNAQSRVLEDVLRRERVPYKVVGGLRFYDRKEIKDVLAYFRVLTNPNDGISFKRIINVPQRSIGKATVEKIEEISIRQGTTFEQALRLVTQSDLLSGSPKKKVTEFVALLDELRGFLKTKTLSEFYHELMDRTRYVEELRQENTEESLSRIENLQEFDSILVEFETMHRAALEGVARNSSTPVPDMPQAETLLPLFLENVTLVGEQEAAATENALNATAGTLSLMTLHTSKGLEFPLVFMVGLEEGLFPSIRPYEEETDEDIEEERRLCYVGMTRAKRKLYMTHAVCRRVYGNIVYHDPARFFQEIPEDFIEFNDLSRFQGNFQRSSRRNDDDDFGGYEARAAHDSYTGPAMSYTRPTSTASGSSSSSSSQVGMKVKHGTYGIGIIRGVEGSSQDAKVTVEFAGRVVKKFVLKFANFEYMN